MSLPFEDLGFLAGDRVRCIEVHRGGHKFYKEGDEFVLCENLRTPNDLDGRWGLWELVERTTPSMGNESDGGPTGYYDFPPEWATLNDYIEYKSRYQWGEHGFHFGNITKALTRWGNKKGTAEVYDAKKILYSITRVLFVIMGKKEARAYIYKMLDDPQFKE